MYSFDRILGFFRILGKVFNTRFPFFDRFGFFVVIFFLLIFIGTMIRWVAFFVTILALFVFPLFFITFLRIIPITSFGVEELNRNSPALHMVGLEYWFNTCRVFYQVFGYLSYPVVYFFVYGTLQFDMLTDNLLK